MSEGRKVPGLAEQLSDLIKQCDALRTALRKALPVLKDAPPTKELLDWNAIGPELFQGVNLQGVLTAARQALAGQPQREAVEGYAPRMRDAEPQLCWRLLEERQCCILDRGHDGGRHEPGP